MSSDVIAVICAHYRLLERLAGRLNSSESSPSRRLVFDEFAKSLGALMRAMDETVIPVLREHGWKQVSSQLLREHVELKHLLGDLLTVPLGTSEYKGVLGAVDLKLRRLQELAAEQLFPWFEATLDVAQRERLGLEIRVHFSCLLGDELRDFDDSEPAERLLEQAKLILGGPTGVL